MQQRVRSLKIPYLDTQLLFFLIYSSDCILPFSFREEEGKKEIKSLQKQLQDVKKETEIELQVRWLNTGHHARGKCVSKLAPAAQELALRWEDTAYAAILHLRIEKQSNCDTDLYSEYSY